MLYLCVVISACQLLNKHVVGDDRRDTRQVTFGPNPFILPPHSVYGYYHQPYFQPPAWRFRPSGPMMDANRFVPWRIPYSPPVLSSRSGGNLTVEGGAHEYPDIQSRHKQSGMLDRKRKPGFFSDHWDHFQHAVFRRPAKDRPSKPQMKPHHHQLANRPNPHSSTKLSIASDPDDDDEYHDCTDPDGSGMVGVCVKPAHCSRFGGRPAAGFCGDVAKKRICCINSVVKCGSLITLNNTYWHSSHWIGAETSCALTISLDHHAKEQSRPICQVRLDFITFSIAQPDKETACSVDTFHVGGAVNKVPVICGDNHGQHMYLNAPSSHSDLQLLFTFDQSTNHRSWNILIRLLPCHAKYLAPPDCLQYFTTATGSVRSFNWRDVSDSTTRQLANQDYKICFRTAFIQQSRQPATTLCLTPCTVFNAATAFSVSQANTAQTGIAATSSASTSQILVPNCNNDYVIIPGGYDPSIPASPSNTLDRYCGERLNPAFGSSNSVSVCTQAKNFNVYYKTNADETLTATVDGLPAQTVTHGNLGFCLSFQQLRA